MIRESDTVNPYQGTRVVVLGASGFIGRWVARALCEKGPLLHLVVRDKEVARELFAKNAIHGDIVEADLTKLESIAALFREIKPSVTFNLAGYGVDRLERDETTAYQVNVHLVKATCEAIAKIRDPNWEGQDIVHIGTALEYGTAGGNLSEDSSPCPTTLYGRSKLAGTSLLLDRCQALRLKGLTARLFTVYGPGELQNRLLPSLVDTARTGRPLLLTAGNQKRDFTYVEDVAHGLLRLLGGHRDALARPEGVARRRRRLGGRERQLKRLHPPLAAVDRPPLAGEQPEKWGLGTLLAHDPPDSTDA